MRSLVKKWLDVKKYQWKRGPSELFTTATADEARLNADRSENCMERATPIDIAELSVPDRYLTVYRRKKKL